MKQTIFIPSDKAVLRLMYDLEEPHRIDIRPVGQRTLEQNDKLHAMLRDISTQYEYCGKLRSVEDWKDIFAASMKIMEGSMDVVPGIEGGVIILGLHTSDMTIKQMIDMITSIDAWAVDKEIVWSEK